MQNRIEAFVQACHKIAHYDLVRCSSGNLSWRVEDQVALLSGSGAWLSEITHSQVAICSIESGDVQNQIRPTCEKNFHLGIMRARSDARVVLHFQSPYATAIACGTPDTYNYNIIIEVPVYIGKPVTVDYCHPGSDELAEKVVHAFTQPDTQLAMLKNHGLVTIGRDFHEAVQRAVFFELACKILLTGHDVKPLSAEKVGKLRSLGRA